MKNVVLGSTGIVVSQNAFGALPIQRVNLQEAVKIIRMAYDGGMRYFDTARAYSDSEEKLGVAFDGYVNRKDVYIATKTMAKTPQDFWDQLNTSLSLLKTDYIDVYQFHCAGQVYKPNDGTGMYECMLEAKKQGKIHHIGITAHKWEVAKEAIESDLYETLQFPFSYLSGDIELKLVELCEQHNMGFIAMKGLAGGLITQSKPAMAFMSKYNNVLPIWGIQKEKELKEWLAFFNEEVVFNDEIEKFIESERKELVHEFCRGCGYCMPCPAGIMINQCARMSLMLRRAPSKAWLSENMQKEMFKIEGCLHCNRCVARCPYELNTPALLKKNLEDYKKVLSGEIKVS